MDEDGDDAELSTVALLSAVFRLEAERTLNVARLGREPGAEQALDAVDAELADAMGALERRGVAYPLHAIARRYQLSQEDYLVMQLALLTRQGPEVVSLATRALGEESDRLRLSHALALIAEGFDDWEKARAELESFPVFRERLVLLEPPLGEDPALRVSPAILELLGLDD